MEQEKSDIQIKALFGWSQIDFIQPYMNHNSEIMANAAYKLHSKRMVAVMIKIKQRITASAVWDIEGTEVRLPYRKEYPESVMR